VPINIAAAIPQARYFTRPTTVRAL
jgi:hypothetical protein